MQLTKEQRIFIARSFDTTHNVTGVVRAYIYQEHFQGRSVSTVTVRRTIAKFCSRGTILNRNKGNSGRLVTELQKILSWFTNKLKNMKAFQLVETN